MIPFCKALLVGEPKYRSPQGGEIWVRGRDWLR